MKTALSRGLSLGLAVALLLVFARPAASHQLKATDPEPDYVLYGFALILYPFGDILNHFFFGPHEKDAPEIESSEKRERKKPKYNFSPRKKDSPENSEYSGQMEMKEEGS